MFKWQYREIFYSWFFHQSAQFKSLINKLKLFRIRRQNRFSVVNDLANIDLAGSTSGAGSFAFKSSFSYLIFRFSCQAVVSLLCEWSWAIRICAATIIAPYWEPMTAPMQMLFWRNNIEAGHTPSPGLFTTIRSSIHRVSSLRLDKKTEKFYTKTNF
jgi:hypothetical protein